MRRLSQHADTIELDWAPFRKQCVQVYGPIEPREWIALFDGRPGPYVHYRDCMARMDHFRSWSKAVRDGLRESEFAALATGVAAETLLEVRKRYRMTGID